MTDTMKRDFAWLWSSGATLLLLSVGGLIYQVKELGSDVQELRVGGSPVLKARLDVLENVILNQQKQFDILSQEMKSDLKEIRRLLEDHMKIKP